MLLNLADLLSKLMGVWMAILLRPCPLQLLEVASHIRYLVLVLKDRVCEVLTWCSGGSHALSAVRLSQILAASVVYDDFSFPSLMFSVDIVDLLGDSRGFGPVEVTTMLSLSSLVAHIIFFNN